MKKKVSLSFIVLVSIMTQCSRPLLGMEMEIDDPDLKNRETTRQLAAKIPDIDIDIRDESTYIYDEDNLKFINDLKENHNKRKYETISSKEDSVVYGQQKRQHSIAIAPDQIAMPLQEMQIQSSSPQSDPMFSRVKADREKRNEETRAKRKEIETKAHEKKTPPNLKELTFNYVQLLQEISQSRFQLAKNSKETTALKFKTKTCEFMVYMPDIDENIFNHVKRNNKDFIDYIRIEHGKLESEVKLKTDEMVDKNKIKLKYSDLYKKKKLLYVTLLNNGFPDNLTGELKSIIDKKTYIKMDLDKIINNFNPKDNISFSIVSQISQHIELRSNYYQNGDPDGSRKITAYHTEILQDLKNAHLFYKQYTTIMICFDKLCKDGLIISDLKNIILKFFSDCRAFPRLIKKSEK
jgi:hypothetical protein